MPRPRCPARATVLLLAAIALPAPSWAAKGAPANPPRDAAEKVQEGNVKNWIEYYQRTRPPPVKPAAGEAEAAPAPPAGTGERERVPARPE